MTDLFKITRMESGYTSMLDWDNMPDEKVSREVVDRYNSSKNSTKLQNKRKVWNECYKHYNGSYVEDTTKKVIQTATMFILIQNLKAKMFRLCFHQEPFLNVSPDDPSVPEENANLVELLFLHQFKQGNHKSKFSRVLDQYLTYGTAALRMGYYDEIVTRTKRPMIDADTSVLERNQSREHYPYFEVVDLFSIFPDMEANTFAECTYIIERQERRLSQILNCGDTYVNIDALVDITKNNKKNKELISKIADGARDADVPYDYNSNDESTDPLVELLVYYEDDRLIVIANEQVVIRNEPNPFWMKQKPFLFAIDYADFNNPFGIGDMEMGLKAEEYKDAITNAEYKYVRSASNHKILINRQGGADDEALTNAENAFIEIDDPMSVKELILPTPNMSAIEAVRTDMQKIMEDLTSMTEYNRGAPTTSETAAGVYAIQEAGNTKLLMKVDMLEPLLQGIAEWFRMLNYQFMDNKEKIKTSNNSGSEEWITLTPMDIEGKFKYSFVGSANAQNKDMLFNKKMQVFNILNGRADINAQYLLKYILSDIDGLNVEKLLTPEQNQQQAMAEAMTQQNLSKGGVSPQTVNPNIPPEEALRLQMSDVNNPNNALNGGING